MTLREKLENTVIFGEIITKGVGIVVTSTLCVPAFIFTTSTVGSCFGAAGGEILDNLLYLNHAIPEGIAQIGNVFSSQNNYQETVDLLNGNLDKIGSVIGLVGGYVGGRILLREYFSSSFNGKSKENSSIDSTSKTDE